MKKTLKIGYSNFKSIITENSYFVDKTLLIKDFYENSSYIILMPRPKRFGKTLNLSMIEYFFDVRKSDSAALFSEFKISKETEFCKRHQNKYPVINISLKGVKETNWESCLMKFKTLISELYQSYRFLLKSDKLENYEKQIFENIILKKADDAEYTGSLKILSNYLRKHFGKRVVVLVDEYDAPIISAFKYTPKPIKSFQAKTLTYYEKIISFMQSFLGDVYKGNEDNLEKGLLTGVMRVGRESIFSEWNNFSVFGITMPYFSDSFGFTQKETEELLTYFGLQNQIDDVKKWYDGYKFGEESDIYNPWSIVNYISKEKAGFKSYWVNSGDYSLIKSRIIEEGVKDTLQDLIEGKTIDKELKENFVFQDFETNNELIWSLLTDNGYLTPVEKSKYGNYKLRVPNYEIKTVFRDIILGWLNQKVRITRDLLIETAEALINNRLIEFEDKFREIIGDTLSYFDTAKTKKGKKAPEQTYHVYTLGLLAILSDDYTIKSNRESGEGRYDILLIPYDKAQNGVVIEIKTIQKKKETETEADFKQRINFSIKKALNQIDKNEYYNELIASKIEQKKIVKLAIVFAGKTPYINEL